jgi:hypothetical protein
VFRAALARVAALCNEQHPGSVTPYRGESEVVVPPPPSPNCSPPSTCHVSFLNTPSEQHLEMRFSRSTAGHGNRFTVLLRDQRSVTVYGHALKYIQNPSNPADYGSYGILSRVSGGEVLTALFRVSEVIGVFSGDLRESDGVGLRRQAQTPQRCYQGVKPNGRKLRVPPLGPSDEAMEPFDIQGGRPRNFLS